MSILSVELHNYKKHRDFKINLDSKSVIVLGDSGAGKSTILNVIAACMGHADFDTKALTDGAEEGEVKVQAELKGKVYTITRKFTKNSPGRFIVTSEDGSESSLEKMLNNILGESFKNKYFDYNDYFFNQKSAPARVEYFTKAIGNPDIESKKISIASLKEVIKQTNADLRGQRHLAAYAGLADAELEDVLAKQEYYKEPRPLDEALQTKALYIKNKGVNVEKLEGELMVIQEHVTSKNEINADIQKNSDRKLAVEEEIKKLQQELVQIAENDEKYKLELKNIMKGCEAKLERKKQEIEAGKAKNIEVIKAADQLYIEETTTLIKFNQDRVDFIKAVPSYFNLVKQEKKLTEDVEKVKALTAEIKETFKNNLPIKELSYEITEDGKEFIFYNGREFTFDNISKGESIKIATKIQRALNPDGANFILIHEAQSLGSGIDEILAEAKKFKVQVIMEITERDKDLTIEFIENDPVTILSKKSKSKVKRIK
jgi:recombinational DNA repair ATPase RecF